MDYSELLGRVDHTQLKAFATWEDIDRLCREALEYRTASVCIPPCYIRRARKKYGDRLVICTVVGFPLGYSVTAAKVAETEQAISDGADEIDMVINISDAKNGDFAAVEREISAVRKASGGKVLKVIVEACYLTTEEKAAVCRAVTNAKADYIKTSTGFGSGGATLEDVRLFRRHIGADVKIKAAGGMHSLAEMEAFLAAGADRLGTSSAVRLVKEAAEH